MNNIADINVDINKKYTTRDGREVVIFEVSDKVYCKVRGVRGVTKGWSIGHRRLDGRAFSSQDSDLDLIRVKTWRAWKDGEAPKFFMVRNNASGWQHVANGSESAGYFSSLFANYDRVHEDGTTTPCGVEE